MQNQRYSRDEFLEMFKQDVIRLSKYIPWLEDKSGDDVSKNYQDGNKMDHTLTFPVYDSILLAFLNDASTTVFMEKNYQYFYTKNHIHDYQDEIAMIERADIMHMDILQCILSRYVFGGMVKAYLWKAGVDHKIFVTVLKKARQIVEFWSEPLVIEDEIPAEGYPEEFTYPEVDEADWTDEEFAAVLSGELNADDIPRLRWEKEHAAENAEASEAAAGAENSVKEIVLPADFVFPEVDDTDWTDAAFENSTMMRHNATFSGGSEKGSFYLSMSYLDNDGIIVGNSDTYERLTGMANASWIIKPWLEIGTNNQIEHYKSQSVAEGNEYGSLLLSVLQLDPLTKPMYPVDDLPLYMASIYAEHPNVLGDGKGNLYGISPFLGDASAKNPFVMRDYAYTKGRGFNINGSTYLNFKPIKGLVFTSRLAYNLSSNESYGVSRDYYYQSTSKL